MDESKPIKARNAADALELVKASRDGVAADWVDARFSGLITAEKYLDICQMLLQLAHLAVVILDQNPDKAGWYEYLTIEAMEAILDDE